MSLPVAVVAHAIPGRTRLRIAERRGDAEYFSAAARQLGSCRGVERVATSPLTGSVLVEHSAPRQAIATYARSVGLFEIAESPEPAIGDAALGGLQLGLAALDVKLERRTGGRWGLGSLAFYSLIAAGLYQMARGEILPAAGALFIKALEIAAGHASGGTANEG